MFSVSIGAMMSSGIFVLPLIAAQQVGPGVAVAYVLAGFVVFPAVLAKAEMATAMPIAGGTYVYVDRSMGPWMGTITGLGTWLSLIAKTSFALVGLGAYLHLISSVSTLTVAVVVLAGLVLLNALGASKASLLQRMIVLACLIALAGFSAGGAASVQTSYLVPALPHGVRGVLAGAGLVVVSYAGVTKVCSIAEEVRHPERNLPLGMIAAQVTAMLIYTVVATIITGNLDLSSFPSGGHGPPVELLTPVATAAEVFWGQPGVYAMSITAIAGLVSMSNAGIMASSRYPFSMARDGLMPKRLSSVHPRLGTPVFSILFTGTVILAAVLVLPVEKLAHLASAFTLFVFCLVNLALMVLRETGARWYRPSFRVPAYPWLPLCGVLMSGLLLGYMGAIAIAVCVGAAVVGTAWYFAFARNRVDRASLVAHVWGQRALTETEHFEQSEEDAFQPARVIVPVFDSQPAPNRLIRLAAAFVDDAILEVMRIEEVPDQTALGALLGSDPDLGSLEAQARDEIRAFHLDLEFHDVLTHNARQALHHRAEATRADWIVAPWPERRRLPSLIRHPLAWWADDPPCDHAQFLDRGARLCKRILVLAHPGPYDTTLVHVADRLAQIDAGEITLFLVGAEDDPHRRDYHADLARMCVATVHSRIVDSDDLVAAVIAASNDFDVLILGAEAELGLRALLFDSRVDRMAAGAACSVLRIKAPRHRVHPHFAVSERTDVSESIVEVLDAATVVPNVAASGKAELFRAMAQAIVGEGSGAAEVEAAIWEREGRQSTALSHGMQVSAPTTSALRQARVGLFVLARPVGFGAPDRYDVDVCVLCVAPAGQRQRQLWLLDQVCRRLARPGVLDRVRTAKDAPAIRRIVSGP